MHSINSRGSMHIYLILYVRQVTVKCFFANITLVPNHKTNIYIAKFSFVITSRQARI